MIDGTIWGETTPYSPRMEVRLGTSTLHLQPRLGVNLTSYLESFNPPGVEHKETIMSSPVDGRSVLPLELWSQIVQILVEQKADASLAALAQTSNDMYDLAIPRLYDTIRLRSLQALESFLASTGISFAPIPTNPEFAVETVEADTSKRPDRRTLIRHFEITDYTIVPHDTSARYLPAGSYDFLMRYCDNSVPIQAPLGYDLFPNVETCYVATKSDRGPSFTPGKLDPYTMFICLVLVMFPAKSLRWQHGRKVSEIDHLSHKLLGKASLYWSRYRLALDSPSTLKVMQLPSTWQSSHTEDLRNHAIYRYYYAHGIRDIRPTSLGAVWYTNPNGNEAAGMQYARLRTKKAVLRARYIKPTHVIQLIPSSVMSPSKVDWRDLDAWRAVAGTITDFAVMANQDLINTKVVSLPEDQSPEEWRQWLKEDALVEGGDVLADLRAVLE